MNHDDLIKQVFLALVDLRVARKAIDRSESLLYEMWAGHQDSVLLSRPESSHDPVVPKKRRGRPPKVNGAVGKGAH